MANTTTAAAAAATTAVVSWIHAYPPLPLLASAAMTQPAGKLLGVSSVNSVWLRASPIICALDALLLIIRCLVYCLTVKATPRQALVIIGADRFAKKSNDLSASTDPTDEVTATERGTTSRIAAVAKTATATAIRLAGFALGVVPLVELIWFEPGGHEAKWTAAWGFLYIGSYLVLEGAAMVYRWEKVQPQYTAADFELDEVEGLAGGETVTAGSGTNGVPYDRVSEDDGESDTEGLARRKSENGAESSDEHDDGHGDEQPGDDAETADLLARGGERSDTAATTTANATSATADIEANKAHPYEYNNDPSSHPRFDRVDNIMSAIDSHIIGIGWLIHFFFIYWAFLDLVQPGINRTLLVVDVNQNQGWQMVGKLATPLYYLSFPFIFLALFTVLGTTLGAGALAVFLLLGIAKLVNSQLPKSVNDWANGIVPNLITVVLAGFGVLCGLVFFFMGSPWIGEAMLSPHMMWIYSTIMVELILFIFYLCGCFIFYCIIKGLIGLFKKKFAIVPEEPANVAPRMFSVIPAPVQPPSSIIPTAAPDAPQWAVNILPYTTDDSTALLAVALHTLLLTLLWYSIRFAGSAHWHQHWQEALVANVTAPHNGTAVNGTANATASASVVASIVAASIAPSGTSVKLF